MIQRSTKIFIRRVSGSSSGPGRGPRSSCQDVRQISLRRRPTQTLARAPRSARAHSPCLTSAPLPRSDGASSHTGVSLLPRSLPSPSGVERKNLRLLSSVQLCSASTCRPRYIRCLADPRIPVRSPVIYHPSVVRSHVRSDVNRVPSAATTSSVITLPITSSVMFLVNKYALVTACLASLLPDVLTLEIQGKLQFYNVILKK